MIFCHMRKHETLLTSRSPREWKTQPRDGTKVSICNMETMRERSLQEQNRQLSGTAGFKIDRKERVRDRLRNRSTSRERIGRERERGSERPTCTELETHFCKHGRPPSLRVALLPSHKPGLLVLININIHIKEGVCCLSAALQNSLTTGDLISK